MVDVPVKFAYQVIGSTGEIQFSSQYEFDTARDALDACHEDHPGIDEDNPYQDVRVIRQDGKPVTKDDLAETEQDT